MISACMEGESPLLICGTMLEQVAFNIANRGQEQLTADIQITAYRYCRLSLKRSF